MKSQLELLKLNNISSSQALSNLHSLREYLLNLKKDTSFYENSLINIENFILSNRHTKKKLLLVI